VSLELRLHYIYYQYPHCFQQYQELTTNICLKILSNARQTGISSDWFKRSIVYTDGVKLLSGNSATWSLPLHVQRLLSRGRALGGLMLPVPNTPPSLNPAVDKQNYCSCLLFPFVWHVPLQSLVVLPYVLLEIMLIHILMTFFVLLWMTWETGTDIIVCNMATLLLCKYHSRKVILVSELEILPWIYRRYFHPKLWHWSDCQVL
jgi:hypothetical protein